MQFAMQFLCLQQTDIADFGLVSKQGQAYATYTVNKPLSQNRIFAIIGKNFIHSKLISIVKAPTVCRLKLF
jgi:hypothetical protein